MEISMKKTILYSIIPAIIIICFSCTTGQKKSSDSTSLKGAWQHVGYNCDSSGHNCKKVQQILKVEFLKDGRLIIGGKQRGIYEAKEEYFIFIMGKGRKSKIQILHINDKELVTQEVGKTRIDKFRRIK